jgi:hypothetical protein
MQAWHMYGNKDVASRMLEAAGTKFPGSHAVALTHAELLRKDQPQEAVMLVEQFLKSTEVLAKQQPSVLQAAVLTEACISYVANGDLGDALDALKAAVAMSEQLQSNTHKGHTAVKAASAARHVGSSPSTSEEEDSSRNSSPNVVSVRANVSGNGASSHSEMDAEVVHALAQPDTADEMLQSIMKEEMRLWTRAAGPSFLSTARLSAPKLAVASAVHAAKLEDSWLHKRLAAAQIALSQALIVHDARLSQRLALDAVRSGKLQPEAHNTAAQVYVALQDFVAATRHVVSGLKVFPNHTGLLRTFAQILREQNRNQDAVMVATYAHDVAAKGPTQVSSAVRKGFNNIRESELGF